MCVLLLCHQGGAVKQYKGLECPLYGFELVLFSLSGTVRQWAAHTSQALICVTVSVGCILADESVREFV